MIPQRAKDILAALAPGKVDGYEAIMSSGEIAEVKNVWTTMPGHTSFYDALVRIAYGNPTDAGDRPVYHITQIPDHFDTQAVIHPEEPGKLHLLVSDKSRMGQMFWVDVLVSEQPAEGQMLQ